MRGAEAAWYHARMRCRELVAAVLTAAVLAAAPARATSPEAAVANDAGARFFRTGAYLDAIAQFDQALTLDPGFAEARRNLATALAAQGQEELRRGSFDDALAHLERAGRLAPDEGAYQMLLGMLHFRRGDLYEARQRIDRALELAPTAPGAREVSGDIYYQEGWLERARAEWEKALPEAAARQPALRAKLDRLGREADAASGFGRDVSRHFTIEYDGPVPGEVARTALRLLEEAYDRLWPDFGRSPQQDVPVILYSRALFEEITGSPAWVAGSFDGKIRVPVGGLRTAQDAKRLRPILAHELTHAFIRANVPGSLPLWFEEGLAVHFQQTTPGSPQRPLYAARPFASLAELAAALQGGPRVAAAYAAAGLAVDEMVKMDGSWLLRRVLEQVAAGRPFPDAFRDAAGIDLAEFEQRWAKAQR